MASEDAAERPLMGKVRTEGPWGILETEDEARSRTRSIYVTLFLSYIGSVMFSVTLPSMALYLESFADNGAISDDQFLGIVTSAFSFGQFLASPLVGWWFNRRNAQEPLGLCMFLLMGGSLMYALATSGFMVLASRFIVGCSFSTVTVSLAYTAMSSTEAERYHYVAVNSACQALGFVTGPIFGAALAFVDFKVGNIAVTPFTAPGYVSCLLGLLGACAVLFFFEEFRPPPPTDDDGPFAVKDYVIPFGEEFETRKYDRVSAAVTIGIYFLISTVFAVFETIAAPFLNDTYEWDVDLIGYFFCGCAGVAVLAVILGRFLSTRLRERLPLMLGLSLLVIGSLGLVSVGGEPVPLARYLTFSGVFSTGYPLSQSFTLSLYSKILGPQHQGTMMGYITSSGSFARILSPLWGTALYDLRDDYGATVYMVLTIIAALGPIIAAIAWKKLVPHASYFLPSMRQARDVLSDDEDEDGELGEDGQLAAYGWHAANDDELSDEFDEDAHERSDFLIGTDAAEAINHPALHTPVSISTGGPRRTPTAPSRRSPSTPTGLAAFAADIGSLEQDHFA